MATMAEAVVDLDAITHNASVFADRTGTGVMAMVKANGFGHGATQAARAALAGGATWLGVSNAARSTRPARRRHHRADHDLALPADGDVREAAARRDRRVGRLDRGPGRRRRGGPEHPPTWRTCTSKLDTGHVARRRARRGVGAFFERASALHATGALRVRGIVVPPGHRRGADSPGSTTSSPPSTRASARPPTPGSTRRSSTSRTRRPRSGAARPASTCCGWHRPVRHRADAGGETTACGRR